MLLSDHMPDISRYRKTDEKIDALYNYLFTLKQQLNMVLENIEESNLSDGLMTRLKALEDAVARLQE